MKNILQTSPKYNYESQKEALLAAVARVLESGWYILGQECKQFEADFAQFCHAQHCLGVANGTDAIELALRAVGVTKNSLVAAVSHTAVATVAAIERIGATPILVDINPATYTMCPKSLQATIEAVHNKQYSTDGNLNKTLDAIVPVHIYGHCADMDAILALAKNIPVIEDCAQAHGARYKSRMAGSMGTASAFSFYPTKNLGAFGDGGAVCCQTAPVAEQVELLRQYGWKTRYESIQTGVNSRLDELQAALLSVRLQNLATDNKRRQSIATLYQQHLSNISALILPQVQPECEHVYHLYVVQVVQVITKHVDKKRDALMEFLKTQGIGTGIHYPLAVHQQHAYLKKSLLAPQGLATTEAIVPNILSLPMHPGLSDEDIHFICNHIQSFFRG